MNTLCGTIHHGDQFNPGAEFGRDYNRPIYMGCHEICQIGPFFANIRGEHHSSKVIVTLCMVQGPQVYRQIYEVGEKTFAQIFKELGGFTIEWLDIWKREAESACRVEPYKHEHPWK